MNEAQAIEIFQRYDDPVNWEYPANFRYKNEVERFKVFLGELERWAGKELGFETESHIQDASFHSQIFLKESVLRFSNFGNMVAPSPDGDIEEREINKIKKLCENLGYTYIAPGFTELKYSGNNKGVTGINSWWVRYFDWV